MIRFGQYARNVGMLVGQSLVQRVLGMVTTVILARLLGAAGFGAYSVVMATSNSAYGLVRLGVDGAIHVHTAEGFVDEAGRRRMEELLAAGCLLLLAAGGIGALACFLFAEPLASAIYGKPELAAWIRVAGVAVFLQSVSQFFYATLAGLHRFPEYSAIMVATAVTNLAAISIGALAFGLAGAVAGLVGAQALSVLWLGIVTRKAMRNEQLRLAFSNLFDRARSLIRLGLPLYISGMVGIPAAYLLQGMLVRSAGLEELGYLRAIMGIVAIVAFAPSSAAGAMISMFARARSAGDGALAFRIVQNIRIIMMFALVMTTGVSVLMPWLIPLLFGDKYLAATGAASVALVTAVLTAVNGVISNALLSSRKVVLLFATTATQALVFVVFGAFLIPEYGLIGYVTAELSGYLVSLTAVLVVVLPWLKKNGMSVTWLMGASLPFLVVAGYAIRHVAWTDQPTLAEAIVGLAGVAALVVWMYYTMLRQEERLIVMHWAGAKLFSNRSV
jgi:O-antigen/teichoic acid export membrane protein